ncbi:putative retrotransposable element tf2 155 kda protein type 1-like [Lyophyllum shimeji]|uniref:Retrotransposable element tf2 155 kDa protein type 1-like n=1 Tax=Lyophyllum shimeji TaxID=47721 RepID=A0A9P3PJ71_LYOSH|nr:putative retrotransposable element tf2 155 kda protein type 1-like [Lyophyllum shimeji]
MSAPTIVSQSSESRVPIMFNGVITPAVLELFKYYCQRFFSAKAVPDTDQVTKVMYNLEPTTIRSWIGSSRAELAALTFAQFMGRIRTKLLDKGWEYEVAAVLHSFQNGRVFTEWVTKVREANATLIEFPAFPADSLREHLRVRFDPELRVEYNAHNGQLRRLDGITDIDIWIKSIAKLDESLKLAAKRRATAWMHKASDGKTRTSAYNAFTTSHTPAATAHAADATNAAAPVHSNRRYCYKMTDLERELLRDNEGCTNCRKIYAGHVAAECPLGDKPLLLADYKPILTREYVEAAHAARLKNASSKGKTKATTVAAVFKESSDDDDTQDIGNEYVLPRHLKWSCVVTAPSIAPTAVVGLIDHGAPPALISNRFAKRLGVPIHKLHKPLRVSSAFSSGGGNGLPDLTLDRYVKLIVQSPCAQWKSRAQIFILSPNLATDIILGLDFLMRNNIVVDLVDRSAIDKTPARRKAEAEWIKDGQEETRKLRKPVHVELCDLFAREQKHFNMDKHSTTPDLIGLVKARIETLAAVDRLKSLDKKLKSTFSDCFPIDIPHVDKLPRDVYHRIEVKPNARISVARAYSCPRKFRDEWKTLIDQHYAAGRIRPSSSQYTSPSFIIPKADPTVLPRWVNDYRTLNSVTVPDNYPLPRVEDILADCAKGKIWGKIDMTNSFFQTLVHPDDVKYTATLTPFGL